MERFQLVPITWWKRIHDTGAWHGEVLGNAPKDAGKEYYLPHFHLSALQGVVDVLQVMSVLGRRDWLGELDGAHPSGHFTLGTDGYTIPLSIR